MKPKPGETVILKGLPPGFIDDLPEDDQRALVEAVGKPLLLHEYDDDGRAELEFSDQLHVTHFIYVDPKFIDGFSPTTEGRRPTTGDFMKGNQ